MTQALPEVWARPKNRSVHFDPPLPKGLFFLSQWLALRAPSIGVKALMPYLTVDDVLACLSFGAERERRLVAPLE